METTGRRASRVSIRVGLGLAGDRATSRVGDALARLDDEPLKCRILRGESFCRDGPAVIHAAKFEEPFTKSAETVLSEPLKFGSVGILRPRGVVPRIVRQGGLFTVHGPPERSLESLTRDRIVKLKQIVIAKSYRSKLLAELARYGINSASLFPDLDGLSSYLNWTVESGEFLD